MVQQYVSPVRVYKYPFELVAMVSITSRVAHGGRGRELSENRYTQTGDPPTSVTKKDECIAVHSSESQPPAVTASLPQQTERFPVSSPFLSRCVLSYVFSVLIGIGLLECVDLCSKAFQSWRVHCVQTRSCFFPLTVKEVRAVEGTTKSELRQHRFFTLLCALLACAAFIDRPLASQSDEDFRRWLRITEAPQQTLDDASGTPVTLHVPSWLCKTRPFL